MGREELIEDPRFAKPAVRVKNDAELDAIIGSGRGTRTKHEAMAQVGGAGVPAGAVLDTMELQNDPTFEQRGIMQMMEHRSMAPSRCRPGRCGSMASRRGWGRRRCWANTPDVLTGWLGLSGADVEKLRGEKVV